jgi:membrane-bound lytic murein transglycosylase B
MRKLTILFFCFVFIGSTYAESKLPWPEWVAELRKEAITQGVSPQVFDQAFATVHAPSAKIKHLSKSQPEHRLTYGKYLHTRVDAYRIMMGKKQYLKNKVLLDTIGQEFGVDPCFIVAFWGMETSYGTYMGDFPVIQALSTLAYESNRPDFFRHELILALKILQGGHVSLKNFKGEWAGASGQSQFLPSSWFEYAVDYDHDGHKDIWESKPDVFASIANYMKKNGWKAGQPWAYEVTLPAHFDKSLMGKTISKPVSFWQGLGVRLQNGDDLPYQNVEASIVQPEQGPVFLALPNYHMILKYNNSIYYAGAIGYLADKVCGRT